MHRPRLFQAGLLAGALATAFASPAAAEPPPECPEAAAVIYLPLGGEAAPEAAGEVLARLRADAAACPVRTIALAAGYDPGARDDSLSEALSRIHVVAQALLPAVDDRAVITLDVRPVEHPESPALRRVEIRLSTARPSDAGARGGSDAAPAPPPARTSPTQPRMLAL